MFGKKSNLIQELQFRIEDLEERLCPCGHDWKQVSCYCTSFTNGVDFDTVYEYKCKRCGKKIETLQDYDF